MTRLTLYFREYCSLCHAMRAALAPYVERGAVELTVIEVDDDPALVDKYDELVPVLCGPDGREVCHWHFDQTKLAACLAEFG